MSYASRKPQSRAEADAHARTLRALVKLPENKHCADCKRNDTRWASWNIGCFLCIRCSGIHRSMGTHISRVKSIDLDIWTPEQMNSIQKWGNKRANAYWEAHLKAGHAPPDHKVESFIRSKYELRRWARQTPIPEDPSVLDTDTAQAPTATTQPRLPPTSTRSAPQAQASIAPKPGSGALLDLLGDGEAPMSRPSTGVAPALAPAPKATTETKSNLFELDWDDASSKNTAPMTNNVQSKRHKDEILSLFSKPSAPPHPVMNDDLFTSFATASEPSVSSALGSLSLGSPPQAPASSSLSSIPPLPSRDAPPTAMLNTQDIWGTPSQPSVPEQEDAFADIWGDFK